MSSIFEVSRLSPTPSPLSARREALSLSLSLSLSLTHTQDWPRICLRSPREGLFSFAHCGFAPTTRTSGSRCRAGLLRRSRPCPSRRRPPPLALERAPMRGRALPPRPRAGCPLSFRQIIIMAIMIVLVVSNSAILVISSPAGAGAAGPGGSPREENVHLLGASRPPVGLRSESRFRPRTSGPGRAGDPHPAARKPDSESQIRRSEPWPPRPGPTALSLPAAEPAAGMAECRAEGEARSESVRVGPSQRVVRLDGSGRRCGEEPDHRRAGPARRLSRRTRPPRKPPTARLARPAGPSGGEVSVY